MKKKKKREYLKILELSDTASRDDIENAYSHFVKLYSFGDSPEIHPLKEEIDSETRKLILADIDKAYKALVGEDAVNRMEFTAEFEPQEINLDEEESAVIAKEELIEHSEKDEEVPVVEFVEQDEPVVELPVEEIETDMSENGEPVVEVPETEEVIVEKDEKEVSESEGHGELEIELPLEEEEGTAIDPDKKTEEPVGIEIELPLEEDISDLSESEEPVFENNETGLSGNEISVEIEHSVSGQSISESEDIIEEQTERKEEVKEITGKYLKKRREETGMKVREVAGDLGISYKDIVNIENEKFEKLSDPGYLRWLIKAYSKLLEIDEVKSAEDYMKRYRSKK